MMKDEIRADVTFHDVYIYMSVMCFTVALPFTMQRLQSVFVMSYTSVCGHEHPQSIGCDTVCVIEKKLK